MSSNRLAAAVEVSGLVRKVEAEGGFAAILRKGDPERGSVLIVVRSRDRHVTCLERMLAMDGGYCWQEAGPQDSPEPQQVADFLKNRVRFDEDLWLIELDIAQPERFIAETTIAG